MIEPADHTKPMEFNLDGKKGAYHSESIPTYANRPTLFSESAVEAFLHDANRYVTRTTSSAVWVPFHNHVPTFRAMTAPQQNWYFYWRACVRENQYPKTSWGYILLYVYEIIHHIGIKDEEEGYEQLSGLWLAYRSVYARLDQHCSVWLLDYVAVYRCKVTPQDVCFALWKSGVRIPEGYANLLIDFFAGKSIVDLPNELLVKLVDYQYKESRFYRSGYQKDMEESLVAALHVVETYMIESYGKGLFEWFLPNDQIAIERQPFGGALYGGALLSVTVATVPFYSSHQPLRDFFTWLIKYIENGLRDYFGFSGRLNVSNANYPDFARLVNRTYARRAPDEPRINFTNLNVTAVARLQKESDEVLAMLRMEEDPQSEHVVLSNAEEIPFRCQDNKSDLKELPLSHIHLLQNIIRSPVNNEALLDIARKSGQMLELMLDEINEWASDKIGDIIVDPGPPVAIYSCSLAEITEWLAGQRVDANDT